MKDKKRKFDGKNVILLIIVMIIVILVIEAILSFTEDLSFIGDNVMFQLGYTEIHRISNIPGLSYELVPNIKKGIFEINRDGFRDYNHDIEKPKGTVRIVILGDSHTFGPDVSLEQTYSKVLERLLNNNSNIKPKRKFEVFNGGVLAYNAIQKIIFLKEKFLKYKPDILILQFTYDDFRATPVLDESSKINPENPKKNELFSLIMPKTLPIPENINRFLLRKSALYRFINMRLYDIYSKINPYKYIPKIYTFINDEKASELNIEAFKEFKKLSEKYNFKPIIVLYPEPDYEFEARNQHAKKLLEPANVIILDLYTQYRNDNIDLESLRIRSNDFHANKKGHKLMGRYIYNYFISNYSYYFD